MTSLAHEHLVLMDIAMMEARSSIRSLQLYLGLKYLSIDWGFNISRVEKLDRFNDLPFVGTTDQNDQTKKSGA
jgi:hypothetical protein